MKPIFQSYLIEVNLGSSVPGVGQQINIQDYPQLRDVAICGIETFSSDNVSVSPSGKVVVSDLRGIGLTVLNKSNFQVMYQYPLYDLAPSLNGGFYRDIVPFEVQLTKCFITIFDTAGIAANESVILNLFYLTKQQFETYKRVSN